MKRIDRVILAIDLKSFYASVECLDRSLDPFTTPLVVADESRGDGTIVLAASPFIKKNYGVPSRCRLSEVDKNIPGLIIAMPRMKRYLEVSAMINGIYLEHVSEEDMHIYSIDESFLDVTNYLSIHKDTPKSFARRIIEEIRSKTGLTVTAGIGLNLFMAKACMDIEAKKSPEFLAQWTYEDIPEHLWPVTPLSKMWGIGSRLEKKLNALGMETVGDIAISDPEYLKSKFGVIGEEIYYHSRGYDDALIQEKYESADHSLSAGQILLRDFHYEEMPTLIRDMAFELSDRMYENKVIASTFYMYIGYKDHTDGFSKKAFFANPTQSAEVIGKEFVKKFHETKNEGILYRSIHLVAADVYDQDCYQPSLFEEENKREEDCRNAEAAVIAIRKKFGITKAMPCSALTLSSNHIQRANQIGGHHA